MERLAYWYPEKPSVNMVIFNQLELKPLSNQFGESQECWMCKVEVNGQIKCDLFDFKNAKCFYLHERPKVVRFIETKSRMVIIRSWGEEEIRSYCLMGRDSVWKEVVVPETDSDDDSQK